MLRSYSPYYIYAIQRWSCHQLQNKRCIIWKCCSTSLFSDRNQLLSALVNTCACDPIYLLIKEFRLTAGIVRILALDLNEKITFFYSECHFKRNCVKILMNRSVIESNSLILNPCSSSKNEAYSRNSSESSLSK